MNILLYNYLQPEDGGGGVGVYSTNLARSLKKAGHTVFTLSSGDAYALTKRKPYLKTWDDQFRRALIVNSPMIAPSSAAWDDFDTYTENRELDGMPELLKSKFGQIDVVHVQNIEGLTGSFLRAMKMAFPAATFVATLHNYGAICAQVDLWFQEREVCVDYRDGLNCTKCFIHRDTSAQVRRNRRHRSATLLLARYAPKIVNMKREMMAKLRGRPLIPALPASDTVSDADAAARQLDEGVEDLASISKTARDGRPYATFRQSNIQLFSELFDHVLAVSERTRQVVLDRGMHPGNIAVSYIGTAHKKIFESATKITSIDHHLHIGYLGYLKRSKGFHLLLQALELLPDDVASRISLTVAAKRVHDEAAYKRLTELAPRFAGFRYFDGFSHKTLDDVLTGVNLGIVPPIWEDNLPQVAIEMVARGIPVLTSDRGGAQEIANSPEFIFQGGSATSLREHIEKFSADRVPLSRFWDGPIQIFSMEEHIADLMQYYGQKRQSRQGKVPNIVA